MLRDLSIRIKHKVLIDCVPLGETDTTTTPPTNYTGGMSLSLAYILIAIKYTQEIIQLQEVL